MRAAIGSTNPVKVAAARAVLHRLYGPGVDLITVDVASGVSAQPWGDVETRQGALNRARAALLTTEADLGLGLEGGILALTHDGSAVAEGASAVAEGGSDQTDLYTSAWCAVVDGEGHVGIAGGANTLLPQSVVGALRSGLELGQVIDGLIGQEGTSEKGGAIGMLTQGQVTRQQAFEQVLTLAFAPLVSPHLYSSPKRSRG